MRDLMVFSMNSGSALFSKADWILFSRVLRVLGRDLVSSANSSLILAMRSSVVRSAGISASDAWRAMSLVSLLRWRMCVWKLSPLLDCGIPGAFAFGFTRWRFNE